MENNDFNIDDWVIMKEERIKFLIKNGFIKRNEVSRFARKIIGIEREKTDNLVIDMGNKVINVKEKDYRIATDKEIKETELKKMFLKETKDDQNEKHQF